MLEDDLWCFGISDDERAVIGEMLAKALDIKPNNNGLYPTAQGELSSLDLFHAINSLLFKFADEVAHETQIKNKPSNVFPIKS
jgi:hypothetical protein